MLTRYFYIVDSDYYIRQNPYVIMASNEGELNIQLNIYIKNYARLNADQSINTLSYYIHENNANTSVHSTDYTHKYFNLPFYKFFDVESQIRLDVDLTKIKAICLNKLKQVAFELAKNDIEYALNPISIEVVEDTVRTDILNFAINSTPVPQQTADTWNAVKAIKDTYNQKVTALAVILNAIDNFSDLEVFYSNISKDLFEDE